MRTANTHPAWENQPLRLIEGEKQNLFGVVEEFYSWFHLQDIREILWEWLSAALSSDSIHYGNGGARSNLIFVYEKLESLIEATYEMHRRKQRKKKKADRKSQHLNK